MKTIDMKIGHTAFLKPYWDRISDYLLDIDDAIPEIRPSWSMDYEKEGGKEDLIEVIKSLHKTINNAETDGYTVVVGNGATQVLAAAISTLKYSDVYVKTPYWFRFPEMIEMSGRDFRPFSEGKKFFNSRAAQIVTYPNNPDNLCYDAVYQEGYEYIYDCCYHWPQYHDITVRMAEDIMVFGLAKATGHAGTRIGWALVKDPEIAKQMARYIEMTSGGVSVEAQERARKILSTQNELHKEGETTCFTYGRSTLTYRWHKLKKHLPQEWKLANYSGMFAWVEYIGIDKSESPIVDFVENRYGIKVLPGIAAGGSDLQFRINMGCSDLDFSRFIDALKRKEDEAAQTDQTNS